MSRTFKLLAIACLINISLTGCLSIKSYVDPAFPKATYDDVKKRSEPLRLKLVVEFQRNGEHFPKADSTLRDDVDRVLRASGIITPTSEGQDGQIKVVMNNIGAVGGAVAKGVATGLTLGLVGSTVTDAYEMDVTINVKGKELHRPAVKHALHTAIGNTSTPEGVEVMPPSTAFGRVVEQMLLHILREFQQSGELSRLRTPILSGAFSYKVIFPRASHSFGVELSPFSRSSLKCAS